VKVPFKKLKKKKQEEFDLEKIKEDLEKNHECYVLITCKPPSKDGKMNVELNYSGDEGLASYLVDGARDVFTQDTNDVKDVR